MKAIGYATPGTLDRDDALVDIEIDRPSVSVNPLDTKVRRMAAPEPGQWKVLGWDAVGRVVAIGESVTKLRLGDRVYYAGSISRPGADSEFHLVDERIVVLKPAGLSDAEAAALPLTAITAWEMLFDRLGIRRPVPGAANVGRSHRRGGRCRLDCHPIGAGAD